MSLIAADICADQRHLPEGPFGQENIANKKTLVQNQGFFIKRL